VIDLEDDKSIGMGDEGIEDPKLAKILKESFVTAEKAVDRF
jgi:hypothetical protein